MGSTNQTYVDFLSYVRTFLRENKATCAEKAISSTKIKEALKEPMGDRLAINSMGNYLSHAATNDFSSGIRSAGVAKGYFLDESALAVIVNIQKTEVAEQKEQAKKERVFREKRLYDHARDWLRGQDFLAKDVSDGRAGAQWGNPDVVGIRISSKFGIKDIEIISIEVKVGTTNWRREIFEAISHKRFANRVYFAFPVFDGIEKIDDDIRRYCEMYRIGVLHFEMSREKYENLTEAKSEKDVGDIGQIEVNDPVPAPYDFVPPRYQMEFLEQIGIRDDADLYRFGS